jgi:hypothetical protein
LLATFKTPIPNTTYPLSGKSYPENTFISKPPALPWIVDIVYIYSVLGGVFFLTAKGRIVEYAGMKKILPSSV